VLIPFSTTAGSMVVTSEPEISKVTITENMDFMVLACDGLWDVLSGQDVIKKVYELLLQHKDATLVCQKLVQMALDAESRDNVSCMLVLFHELNK